MTKLYESKPVWLAALVACALYFSGFLVILTPLPLMYPAITRGRDWGRASAGLAAAVVFAIYLFALPHGGDVTGWPGYVPAPGVAFSEFMPEGFLPTFGLGYFAFFAAIALALSWGVTKRLQLSRLGGYALIAGLATVVATLLAAKAVCTGSLVEGARSYILHVFGQIVGANQSAGLQNAQLAFLADNTDRVAMSIVEILPSLAFVYAIITVAINLVLGRKFMKARGGVAHVPGVARFRLPDWLIWTVIASGGIFFINSYVVQSLPVRTMALNGLIGVGVLYFLQGMAVTVYFLQRVRFSLLRTIAYIAMIIFLQTVSVALIVLGIADVWADFRLRHLKMQHQQ